MYLHYKTSFILLKVYIKCDKAVFFNFKIYISIFSKPKLKFEWSTKKKKKKKREKNTELPGLPIIYNYHSIDFNINAHSQSTRVIIHIGVKN